MIAIVSHLWNLSRELLRNCTGAKLIKLQRSGGRKKVRVTRWTNASISVTFMLIVYCLSFHLFPHGGRKFHRFLFHFAVKPRKQIAVTNRSRVTSPWRWFLSTSPVDSPLTRLRGGEYFSAVLYRISQTNFRKLLKTERAKLRYGRYQRCSTAVHDGTGQIV